MGDIVRRGGSRTSAKWMVEAWWREIQDGLHCLLNTQEGYKLAATIEMFRELALYRIEY